MNEWVGGAICLSEWRRQGLLAVALVAAVGCVDWNISWHRGQKRRGHGLREREEVVVQSSSSWLVYERFLLPSKFLKLDGLIFISANSMECSWPFQWNQLTPLL